MFRFARRRRDAPVPTRPATPPSEAEQKLVQERQKRVDERKQQRRTGSLKRLFHLGDAIEQMLSSVGVTEERVTSWLGRPCGCRARKQKLNDLSRWFHAKLRGEEPPLPFDP